jgi:hypothetical protein
MSPNQTYVRTCAVCGTPDVSGAVQGWVEIRLYLGPGDKLAEITLDMCERHLVAFRPAYERELVECRVTRWERDHAT